MRSAFITIESHSDHPRQIRIIEYDRWPNPPQGTDGGDIRYIARFNDIDAARMHIHEELRHQCEDIDAHRYKAELAEAIAAAEAVALKHERVWMDPTLDEATLSIIDKKVSRAHKRHQLVDLIARIVGGIAVALLILRMFGIF